MLKCVNETAGPKKCYCVKVFTLVASVGGDVECVGPRPRGSCVGLCEGLTGVLLQPTCGKGMRKNEGLIDCCWQIKVMRKAKQKKLRANQKIALRWHLPKKRIVWVRGNWILGERGKLKTKKGKSAQWENGEVHRQRIVREIGLHDKACSNVR